MIDIHNHMLNNVDDGSSSFELSLTQLISARSEGIEDIILTPHFIFNDENSRKNKEELTSLFLDFSTKIKEKVDINLYLGNELFIHSELDELLLNKEIATLANSRYVLVEFPFDKYEKEYDEYLYNLKISGYIVIIAHPERYNYVLNNPSFVKRWIDEGYLLQCNQNSLKDRKSAKVVFSLIEKGFVYFIASDAHNDFRPTTLKEAYNSIRKKYGEEQARRLFKENPLKVLQDQEIEAMPTIRKKFLFI